jgi:uncharacterized protein YaaW (UPF0174 family)
MAVRNLRTPDKDLIPLLRSCSDEELENLVEYVTRKGGVSSQLETTRNYKKFHPRHSKYADEIAAEIQKFGGNTILNYYRCGKGVHYREIVHDVADRLKIGDHQERSVEAVENLILFKVLEEAWKKMSDAEKKNFLKQFIAEKHFDYIPQAFPTPLLQAAVLAGGVWITYELALFIANIISRRLLGRGIAFISGAILRRWMPLVGGVIGSTLSALWVIFDVAGPAYRVTVPCVIHIAMLRQLHKRREEEPQRLPYEAPDFAELAKKRPILFETFTPPSVTSALNSGNLENMIAATALPAPPVARNALLSAIVEKTYKHRHEAEMQTLFSRFAQTHLNEFPKMLPGLKREYGEKLPVIPTFRLLALVLVEEEKYNEAIKICETAIAHGLDDGTKTGFEGRIERIQRKMSPPGA